eukprot:121051-Prymnesium_polylepis.1
MNLQATCTNTEHAPMGKTAKAAAKARMSAAKGRSGVSSTTWGIAAVVGLACVVLLQWWLSTSAPDASVPEAKAPRRMAESGASKKATTLQAADEEEGGTDMSAVMQKMGMLGGKPEPKATGAKKHASLEWTSLPRELPACLTAQEELMTIPVDWPGFHALCIESVDGSTVVVRLHNRSGQRGRTGTRSLTVEASPTLVDGLISTLKEQLS